MKVYPSNNTGAELRALAEEFPDRLGHMIGPEDGAWRKPFLPYALDNGAWHAHKHGVRWKQREYLGLCEKAVEHVRAGGDPPLWLLVPDVVADRDKTLWNWEAWASTLTAWYGWPLAFAVQDGMMPADVPQEAAVVFIGGTTEWKHANIEAFCRHFPRVHVGRLNGYEPLRRAALAGAESCDGTGFFRGDRNQLEGLRRFLEGR